MRNFVVGMALLLAGFTASSIASAQSCGGNLIDVKPLVWGDGTRMGELQVYYNPANGNNCARTVHSANTWGVSKYTEVSLRTCTRNQFVAGQGCPYSTPAQDANFYLYQAGPVSMQGQDRCITALGSMARQGTSPVTAAKIIGHCGGG